MVGRLLIITLTLCVTFGCIHSKARIPEAIHFVAPFESYLSRDFDWNSVQRIVLMPFANQAAVGYPRIGDEMLTNLATELQRAGRFEIVVATHEDAAVRAHDLFTHGQFNEIELLRIAREYQADAVLFANVTQYHPYSPPRIGMSVMLLSPTEGISIASTNGLWDAREKTTAAQAHEYFKRTQNFPKTLMGHDRTTESPNVFQRFVCQQIADSLCKTAADCQFPNNADGQFGATVTPGGMMPPGAIIPQEGMVQPEGMTPHANEPTPISPP